MKRFSIAAALALVIAGTSLLIGQGSYTPPAGGSTAPGGSNGQPQYNNSGAFGGFSGLNIAAGALTIVNPSTGFEIGGAAASAHYLRGNGTNYIDGAIQAGDVPTLNQSTTGSAAKWTSARNLAGNSVDGSANVPFANAFIAQGTTDAGLSGAQFLGALGTGIVKNTTTTGVLSIAVAGDFPTLNQNTTGTASNLSGTPALPNGTTATTQSPADNSTKFATTAYVDQGTAFLTAQLANTFSASYSAQTLTGLSFSIQASKNYVITCDFMYVVTGTNTGTPNYAITGPVSPTNVMVYWYNTGVAANALSTLAAQNAPSFPTQFGPTNTTTLSSNAFAHFVALIENGLSAGTVQIKAGATGTGTVTFNAFQSACVMK